MVRILTSTSILLMVLLFCQSYAIEPTICASAEPSMVRIGDRIHYNVILEYPSNARAMFLARSDSMLGAFNIIHAKLDSVSKIADVNHQELHYELVYFGITDNIIPPIAALVVYPDARAETLLTQPIRIQFVSLLGGVNPDSAQIRDIKPPKSIPFNFGKTAMSMLWGFGLFLLFLGAVWAYTTKRKGIGLFEFISPPKPPWVIAMMKLDALAESDLLKNGEFKEYFDRLTDIHREYIERRFGVQSLELSTTETMENLRDARLDVDETVSAIFIGTTEELLRRADLVKFAKFTPDIQTALEDWETIRRLIEQTTPRQKEQKVTEQTETENEKQENQ